MIETERLLLTRPSVDDHAAVRAMFGDPAVMRHITGQPMSADDAWVRLLRSIGHWSAFGWGLFAIRDRATGDYLGETGLATFRRELGEDFDSAPEAAWILTSATHGKGIAAEAAAAAHEWFAREHGAQRSVCIIAPDNAPSLKLAERLGYRRYREAPYKGATTIVLERQP